MRGLGRELRDFLMRGNVIDLAVAVVVGAAFGTIVTSFTDDILMQAIAAVGGQPDFSSLAIDLGDGRIRYGSFLNALINFALIGTAMFFVVKGASSLYRRRDADEQAEVDEQLQLLAEIRDLLREQAP